MIVPSGYVFLLHSVSFSGSGCEADIVFQVYFHHMSTSLFFFFFFFSNSDVRFTENKHLSNLISRSWMVRS